MRDRRVRKPSHSKPSTFIYFAIELATLLIFLSYLVLEPVVCTEEKLPESQEIQNRMSPEKPSTAPPHLEASRPHDDSTLLPRKPSSLPSEAPSQVTSPQEPTTLSPTPRGVPLEILVVDSTSGLGISEAEVWLLDIANVDANLLMKARAEGKTLQDIARSLGRKGLTNAEGRVDMTWSGESSLAMAFAPGLLGEQEVHESPCRIELRQESSLLAEVFDGAGRPVPKATISLRAEPGSTYTQANTDDTGLAKLSELTRALESARRFGNLKFSLHLGVPGTGAEPIPIDLETPSPTPHRFLLEPTGQARIYLFDRDGDPIRLPAQATIRPTNSAHPSTEITILEHPTTLPHVVAGRTFDLELGFSSRGSKTTRSFSGPRHPEEQVEIKLVLDDLVLLNGRLLDPDRTPRSGAVFTVLEGGQPLRDIDFCLTDAEGEFNLPMIRPRDSLAGVSIRIKLENAEAGRETGVDLVLPDPLEPGIHRLGDVVLADRATLVAGTVVDEDGKSLPGVEVSLGKRRGNKLADVRTDGQGRFRFGAIADPSADLRLSARVFGRIQVANRRFDPGDDDVVIRLSREGIVIGSLHIPEAWTAGAFRIALTHSAGKTYIARVHSNGSFRADKLPQGIYSLTVGPAHRFVVNPAKKSPSPLLVIDDIDVDAGETNKDPRLQGIQITDSLRGFVVRALDESRSSIPEASLHAKIDDRWYFCARGAAGFTVLLDRAASVDLAISAPGFQSEIRTRMTKDLDVVLEPAIPALVRLHDLPDLKGRTVRFWIERSDATLPDTNRFFRVSLPDGAGKGGPVPVSFPSPGEYYLASEARSFRPGGNSIRHRTKEWQDLAISVGREDHGVTFSLQLPVDLID